MRQRAIIIDDGAPKRVSIIRLGRVHKEDATRRKTRFDSPRTPSVLFGSLPAIRTGESFAMRIGVLEWASCVGPKKSSALDDSIRQEGWAMCTSALTSLARSGHQAVAVVRAELTDSLAVKGWSSDQLELIVPLAKSYKRTWKEVYAACDATLVIAPECDRILQDLLQWCQDHKVRTCNASGVFLANACDKFATAARLGEHQIPHPPTRLLSQVDRNWVRELSDDLFALTRHEALWVVKPRYGVGCAGIVRMTSGKIEEARKGKGRFTDCDQWIVQPWLGGKAYSRAAIEDNSGEQYWLPITTQHLSITDSVRYCGGIVKPSAAEAMPHLDDLLTRASAALGDGGRGWVGFDFLHDASNIAQPLTVIEVNPRLTTSFVGLCAAGAPDLAAQIVAACHGRPVQLASNWQAVQFTAS